jgi:integrase/recombinase XerD
VKKTIPETSADYSDRRGCVLNNEEILNRYCSRLIAVERRSPLTASTYRVEIRRFLDYLEAEKLNIAGVGPCDLNIYLEKRRERDHIDSRSTAKAVSCLRSFFRFLTDERLRKDNPALVLELPLRRLHLPHTVNKEKLERLFALVDTRSPLGLRNRAIYEFIYSAGLRVSEAVGLNIKDVDLDGNIAKVRGKGRKERVVVFGAEAASWIRRYLEESRPDLTCGHAQGRNSQALFIGRTGKRLSRKGIWKNYSRVALVAGTSSRIHDLRHSFATDLLAGGADLRTVQELLGHANLSSTQIYTHVDVSMLKDSHKKYLPTLKNFSKKQGGHEFLEGSYE